MPRIKICAGGDNMDKWLRVCSDIQIRVSNIIPNIYFDDCLQNVLLSPILNASMSEFVCALSSRLRVLVPKHEEKLSSVILFSRK